VKAKTIDFYSGNLSVGYFMHYWGTAKQEPFDRLKHEQVILNQSLIELLQRNRCTAMVDYLAWCCAEPEQGKWDWSYYVENARILGESDIGYVPFCWLHFPPEWYETQPEFVPYQNLETGRTIPQVSLWSPDLLRIYDEFYRRLADELGSKITFLRLAMPSEYGEVGYCAGMTKWLRPQEYAQPGYWCGDPFAADDFKQRMLNRYKTLKKINSAWGTDYKSSDAVRMPNPKEIQGQFDRPESRQHWVDFVDWYNESWALRIEQLVHIVRRHFPDQQIVLSLGYGSERACYGNDQGRYVQLMHRLAVVCQAPGDIGYIATRRVSSACRTFGVPYFTEPPGDVSVEREIDRIFADVSNGVQTWFDYPQNLDRAREHFERYAPLLDGEAPETTLAVWHPTLDHWLHPDSDWSQPTLRVADALREFNAFEIVDDRMIRGHALQHLGIRQLVLAGAKWLDRDAWQQVHRWVKRGGVFLVLQDEPVSDIHGDTSLWKAQQPADTGLVDIANRALTAETRQAIVDAVWSHSAKRIGKGWVLALDTKDIPADRIAWIVSSLCMQAGTRVGKPDWNLKFLDNGIDGILSTLFPSRILYYNKTSQRKTLFLSLREEDFPEGQPRPSSSQIRLEIDPKTIAVVPLDEANKFERPERATTRTGGQDRMKRADEILAKVAEYADNAIQYGRDVYGEKPSPLFVDGLNVLTRKPVIWRLPADSTKVSSKGMPRESVMCNFASQQTLLRVLDGLTDLTGEPRYRQAATETIEYAFENLQHRTGLLFWGGHLFVDLATRKFVGEAHRDASVGISGLAHELKCSYPHYELMYQVNPEATVRLICSIWANHIVNWETLEFNRHGYYDVFPDGVWDHEYKGGEVPIVTKNMAFINTGSDLFYAGSMLYHLTGEKPALEWSKRLLGRYEDIRHPKTGLAGYQFTIVPDRRVQRLFEAKHGTRINESTIVNVGYTVQRHALIVVCRLRIAEMLGNAGKEFFDSAIADVVALARHGFDRETNTFWAMNNDGLILKPEEMQQEGYFTRADLGRRPVTGLLLWAYALAFRLTRDPFLQETVTSMGQGLGLWDSAGTMDLETETSDVHTLMAALELYEATKEDACLSLAERIGTNLLEHQFRNGFFVNGPRHINAPFGHQTPLALLSLISVMKEMPMPKGLPSNYFFHCEYEGLGRTYDKQAIYTQEE